jgi:hypothetical protein
MKKVENREELFTHVEIGFWKKAYYWWKFDGRYLHKTFLQGCKNLVKWFPIIWKDRDYDHSYIFSVIKFKLEKQAKYLDFKDRFESTPNKVKYMNICSRLLERLMNDTYGLEYQNYIDTNFYSKLSDYKGEDNGDYYELEIETSNDRLDDYFRKHKSVYNKISNKTDDRHSIALKIAQTNHNRARKLLFKILEEHIEGWWD